jgi:hypothetical protein
MCDPVVTRRKLISDQRIGVSGTSGDWLDHLYGRTDARETAADPRSRGVEPLQAPFEVYTGLGARDRPILGQGARLTDYVKEPARARG